MGKTTRIWSVLGALSAALLLSASVEAAGNKVFLIDSYDTGYAWSDGIIAGAKDVLADKYELKVFHMDTKRNTSEEAKKAVGEKVKAEIDSWKPDIVIACDDNATKYVILPYYKNTAMPVIFCGINWDASDYGFPCSNVTGMLEVSVINPLMDTMKKYAKGDRVGFLGADNETDHVEAVNLTKKFGLKLTERFVKTFEEWKAAYVELQDKTDMVILVNKAGIKDWDETAARKLVRDETKVPSGSCHDHMAPLVLVTYAKLPTEQGGWAAGTAIQVLEGKSIKDIPIAANQKGQFYVNLPVAAKLGIKFSLETLKAAKVVKE